MASPEWERMIEIRDPLRQLVSGVEDLGVIADVIAERTATPFDRIAEALFVAWVSQLPYHPATEPNLWRIRCKHLAAASKRAANVYLETVADDLPLGAPRPAEVDPSSEPFA